MHIMRNLGKWKKPISRIFGVPDPAGSFFGLGSTILRILHFLSYFIVFFVSRLQIVPVLCAAASVRL